MSGGSNTGTPDVSSEAELTASVDPSLAPTPADVGARFAEARAAAQMSVSDVAQHLKLSPAQVEALEAGEYDKLPGPVFVRGFIRNYARLLSLDASSFLTQVQTRGPQVARTANAASTAQQARLSDTLPPSKAGIPFPKKPGTPWHIYGIVAAVLAVPVLIFQFFYRDQPVDDSIAVQTHAVQLPAPEIVTDSSAPVETEALTEQSETSEKAESETPAPHAVAPSKPALQPQKETTSVVEDVIGKEDETPETALSTAMPESVLKRLKTVTLDTSDGTHALTLSFAEDAWTEIYDARGQRIFWQLGTAGTTRRVSGIAPLVIVIGNAHAVQLEVDGKALDIAPYTRTDVARFKLQ